MYHHYRYLHLHLHLHPHPHPHPHPDLVNSVHAAFLEPTRNRCQRVVDNFVTQCTTDFDAAAYVTNMRVGRVRPDFVGDECGDGDGKGEGCDGDGDGYVGDGDNIDPSICTGYSVKLCERDSGDGATSR